MQIVKFSLLQQLIWAYNENCRLHNLKRKVDNFEYPCTYSGHINASRSGHINYCTALDVTNTDNVKHSRYISLNNI